MAHTASINSDPGAISAVSTLDAALGRMHGAVVVPAYQAGRTLASVVQAIPEWVRTIVIVDDGSTDGTATAARVLATANPRVVIETHERNRGVGMAMRTGYARALAAGAEVIAKMDSDGQMDPAYLARLVVPVATGTADYAKGNRFRRPDTVRRMPTLRLIGNGGLSFVSKLSSGYWHVMDPTNGYTAVSREALQMVDLDRLDPGWFFESSMLVELGLVRAVVADVAMPARYGDETSHLPVVRSLLTFGPKHLRAFVRRLVHRHLLVDFTPVSLFLTLGLPLVVFGVLFGGTAWLRSIASGVPATAGTVMLAAATTGVGLYCLLQALLHDIMSTPQRPLTPPHLVLTAVAVAPVPENVAQPTRGT